MFWLEAAAFLSLAILRPRRPVKPKQIWGSAVPPTFDHAHPMMSFTALPKSPECVYRRCLQHSGWSPVILLSNNHNHTKLFTVHAFLRSPSLIILEAILWDRNQMLSAKANTRVDYELGGAYTPASVTVASRCFSYYCRSRKLGAFQNKNDMARLLHDNIKPLNIILLM